MFKPLRYGVLLLLCFSLVLNACSNNEGSKPNKNKDTDKTEKKKEEKKQDSVPEAATEPEDIVDKEAGKLFSKDLSDEDMGKKIKQMPDNLSADDAYNRLVDLFRADYHPVMKEYEEFDPSFDVGDAPDDQDSNESKEEKEKLHVALLMDASGSMGARVNGEVKMKSAKDALKEFASDLPNDAKTLLRVYGYKGTGSQEDKKKSCNSNKVFYPLSKYKDKKFQKSLSQFKPAGWTPLAASIKAAKKDLKLHSGKNIKNVVYVVSDGEETCGGDPVKAAKQLHKSGISAKVNIIGFDVSNKEQQQLKKVADAGGGSFTNAHSGEEMFDNVDDILDKANNAVQNNLFGAKEGVDLQWEFIHKIDDLDDVASDFGDIIDSENDTLLTGLQELQEADKIKESETNKLRERIEERRKQLHEFSDEKTDGLKQRVDDEKQKASDEIDKKRKE